MPDRVQTQTFLYSRSAQERKGSKGLLGSLATFATFCRKTFWLRLRRATFSVVKVPDGVGHAMVRATAYPGPGRRQTDLMTGTAKGANRESAYSQRY